MRNFNATAILWIKKDFDLIMSEIEGAINDSFEREWQEKEVKVACEKMKYLVDLLTFIQLKMPAILLKEVIKGCEGLIELHGKHDQKNVFEELREATIESFLLIPNLLEYLSEGNKDIPEVISPVINKIRDLLGVKRIQPSEMFWPDVFIDTSFLSSDASYKDEADIRQRLSYLGVSFDGFLVNWIKNENAQESLKGLSSLSKQIYEIAPSDYDKKLFWVSECLFLALSQNEFTQSLHTRHILAKLSKRIKFLSEILFEKPQCLDVQQELFKDSDALLEQLLFSVAFEGSHAPSLEDVIIMFQLDEFVYTPKDVEKASAILSGRNQNVMELVARGIREDLYVVKDAMDLYLVADQNLSDTEDLSNRILRAVSALAMIEFKDEAQKVQDLQHVLKKVVDSIQAKDSYSDIHDQISYLVGAIVQVDNVIASKIVPESFENVTEKSLQLKLLNEAFSNISKTKQSIIYFSENKDYSKIADVTKWTNETADTISVLGDKTAHVYFKKLNDLMESLQSSSPALTDDDIFSLASAVSCLEYYLEAKRDRQPDPYRILEESRQFFQALGEEWDPVQSSPVQDFSHLVKPVAEPVVGQSLDPSFGGFQEEKIPSSSIADFNVYRAQPTPPQEEIVVHGQKIVPFDNPEGSPIDDELKMIFAEELQEEIDSIKLSLATLEKEKSLESLFSIRKSFHTLKGSGRMIGALTLGDIACSVENVLNKKLDTQKAISPTTSNLISVSIDMLEKFSVSIAGGDEHWEAEEFNSWCESLLCEEDLPFKVFKKMNYKAPSDTTLTPFQFEQLTTPAVPSQPALPEEISLEANPEQLKSLELDPVALSLQDFDPGADYTSTDSLDNDLEVSSESDGSFALELLASDEEEKREDIFDLIKKSSLLEREEAEKLKDLDKQKPSELLEKTPEPRSYDFSNLSLDNAPVAPSVEPPAQPVKDFLEFSSLSLESSGDALTQVDQTPKSNKETKEEKEDFSEMFNMDSLELVRSDGSGKKDNIVSAPSQSIAKDDPSKEFSFGNLEIAGFEDVKTISPDQPAYDKISNEISAIKPIEDLDLEDVARLEGVENNEYSATQSFEVETLGHVSVADSPYQVLKRDAEEPAPSFAIFSQEQEKEKDATPAPFPGYSSLPPIKNIQQNGWKENLSLLLDHINTVGAWSNELELALNDANQNKMALMELKDQLLGFQKRAVALVEASSFNMTASENKILKQEIRPLIEDKAIGKNPAAIRSANQSATPPAEKIEPAPEAVAIAPMQLAAAPPPATPAAAPASKPAVPTARSSNSPSEFKILKEEKKSFFQKIQGIFSRKK